MYGQIYSLGQLAAAKLRNDNFCVCSWQGGHPIIGEKGFQNDSIGLHSLGQELKVLKYQISPRIANIIVM